MSGHLYDVNSLRFPLWMGQSLASIGNDRINVHCCTVPVNHRNPYASVVATDHLADFYSPHKTHIVQL